MTEDERKARDDVMREAAQDEARRRAIERGEWVDEMTGFVLERNDPESFAEAAAVMRDLSRIAEELLGYPDDAKNLRTVLGSVLRLVDRLEEAGPDMNRDNMLLFGFDKLIAGWEDQARRYREHK